MRLFKTNYVIFMLSLLSVSMTACSAETSFINKRNVEHIAHYVTCPTDTIRMMLEQADSVCALYEKGILDNLDLANESYNEYINQYYSHRIPSMVQLYATYDAVTCFPTNEANAAFAWHEIAQRQIADFYGKEEVTNAEIESYFDEIDSILYVYDAGSQRDMNNVAYRRVMMADYRMITAYKRLYDKCAQPSLLPSIQGSYCHVFKLFQTYCNHISGYWSDLPRQLACVEYALLEDRQHAMEQLLEEYERGEITIENIKAVLDERPNSIDDLDIDNY